MKRGFTLIELLVVVLIIAVLAAIALPQYQKAVLKSRYSALMPIARAIANAQELYYMEHGHYTSDITKLDIKAPSNGASASIEVSDGTDERFEYVLAYKEDLPGLAYVIYLQRSPQFANAVMCEANEVENKLATWLCKEGLKGTQVDSGSLQGGYWDAYLITGQEGTSKFSDCSVSNRPLEIKAARSEAIGTATCENGEWKYTLWRNGKTFTDTQVGYSGSSNAYRGATFSGSEAKCMGYGNNVCSGATFKEGARCAGFNGDQKNACSESTFLAGTNCWGHCTNSTFTGARARCMPGGGSGQCGGSTFTNGAFCEGGSVSDGCRGAIINEGGYCYSGCVGSIINDGGYCYRGDLGCDEAIYPENGTGCCVSCSAGSGIRKCPNKVWDGESYW